MCVSLRGHSTGLGVAGFAIRSRRDDGIDHGRCIVARSPKTMTKTRADPSARLKPPDSPAATRRGPKPKRYRLRLAE